MRRLTLALLSAVVSHSAYSQGPTVSGAQSALRNCSYETCALRIEPGFFGGRTLVAGLDGVRSNMGILGGGLINVVDRVPSALKEAKLGRRNAIVSTIAGIAASLAITVALNGLNGSSINTVGDGQVFGAIALGTAGAITAGVQRVYAERHFSRAIWLYNREAAR